MKSTPRSSAPAVASAVETIRALPDPFGRRFGLVGAVLADAFPWSIDVIGVIASYAHEPRLLRKFSTHPKLADGCVVYPYNITVDSSTNMVIVSDNHTLAWFDQNGKLTRQTDFSFVSVKFTCFGNCPWRVDSERKLAEHKRFHERLLALDKTGDLDLKASDIDLQYLDVIGCRKDQNELFVIDCLTIAVLSLDGQLLRRFACVAGQTSGSIYAAVSRTGRCYVKESTSTTVRMFDGNGKRLGAFKCCDRIPRDGEHLCTRIACDALGRVLIVTNQRKIRVFSADGVYLTSFQWDGGCSGALFADDDGLIYIGDTSKLCVHVFTT